MLTSVQPGQEVAAFHPRMLGVVKWGRVVKVGSVWIHIDFGELLGGTFRVLPGDVIDTA